MTNLVRSLAVAAATLLATTATAPAVTISSGASQPAGGVALALDPADFVASGGPGSGGSVIGDPTEVSTKDEDSPRPFGRFDPFGGYWVDSNDNPEVVWTLENDAPIRSISFALTDAFDQRRSRTLGRSFFNLSVGDATFSIDEREENGALRWIEVLLDEPTDSVELVFQTRLNDGWGVSEAKLAPVPLPPALLLAASGFGLIALVGARRRARSA